MNRWFISVGDVISGKWPPVGGWLLIKMAAHSRLYCIVIIIIASARLYNLQICFSHKFVKIKTLSVLLTNVLQYMKRV